jgi:catechol 2,3-dioxygenase-like lactoylglutathione lyase family enzyme
MGFHHVALATRDTAATHDFYTRVMGFRLAKVVTSPTPGDHGGWSKHFFYETGSSTDNGMIAFWEIHDTKIGTEFSVDLNKAAGLEWWVNHIAFDAPTRDDLDRHRQRWQDCGFHVLQMDHDFCVSIYIRDPNNNMVEFCHTVRDFSPEERQHAIELLNDSAPALEKHDVQARVWEPTPADG